MSNCTAKMFIERYTWLWLQCKVKTGLVFWVIISTFPIGWITANKKGGKFKLQYIQYTEGISKERD